ncbi:MAG TPA: hypothetical protein VGL81_22280 [Polyangiaceae bacterium]
MEGFRARISRALGWPTAQLRKVAAEVKGRLDASREEARVKYEKARAENAGKVVEVSPPSSKGPPSTPPSR